MNEVNFLPEVFVREQARRKRVLRQAVLLAAVALSIVSWFFLTRSQVIDLARYAEALESEARARKTHVTELARLNNINSVLDQQLRVQRQLVQPISLTQVLAILTRMTPDGITVRELSMVGVRPRPTQQARIEPGRPARPVAAEPRANSMQINLVGVAARDADIANLVGTLTEHPMFENVKLGYSRATELSHLMVREFQLSFEVPLDRDYQPLRPTETAHAR
jgi:Tfp pilus assembly protein PilN